MRSTWLMLTLFTGTACSSGGAGSGRDLAMELPDARSGTVDDAGSSDPDGSSADGGGSRDSGSRLDLASRVDLLTPPDLAWNGVFTVRVLANNVCKISSVPDALAVPAHTSFKVNWVNSAASSYNIDIDKIDMFNQVPLIIGLESAMSWTDTRDWCGVFTGTFSFRIRIGCDTYYIPVNCNK